MFSETNGTGMWCLAAASAGWDRTPLPACSEGRPPVTLLRAIVAPGERSGMRHSVIDAGSVLRGARTEVVEDGRWRTFRAGEAIVEPVSTPLHGENRGAEPVERVMCYAGTEGLPLSEPTENAGRP